MLRKLGNSESQDFELNDVTFVTKAQRKGQKLRFIFALGHTVAPYPIGLLSWLLLLLTVSQCKQRLVNPDGLVTRKCFAG